MKLLPLMCLFVLMWSGQAVADGPTVVSVKEDGEVVLPCSFGDNDMTDKRFDWKKDNKDVLFYDRGQVTVNPNFKDQNSKDRVTHFSDLKSGNVSIRIKPVRLADSGTYTCINPDQQPNTRGAIHLEVECILKDRTSGPNGMEGACSKPRIKQFNETVDGVLLHLLLCSVSGVYPKPEVELQDSSYNPVQSEDIPQTKTGEKYNVVIHAVVKKTGEYRCVAKQLNICHETFSDWTSVNFSDKQSGWLSGVNPWIIGIIGISFVLGIAAVLVGQFVIQKCRK